MSSLRKLAEGWIEKRPFLKEYMELHFAIDDVFMNTQVAEVLLANIQKCKGEFEKGTELIHIKSVEIFEMELAERVFRELPSIAESYGFPEKLVNSIKDIGNHIVADKSFAQTAIQKALKHESFEEFEKEGLNSGLVLLFAQKAIEKAIQTYNKSMSEFLADNRWNKKTCPVCGTCRAEWNINRIECPYCQDKKQENIRIIEFDTEKDLRIDICNACKSYIKTYTGNSVDDIAMRDFASIHIDIASGQTGFKRVGALQILD